MFKSQVRSFSASMLRILTWLGFFQQPKHMDRLCSLEHYSLVSQMCLSLPVVCLLRFYKHSLPVFIHLLYNLLFSQSFFILTSKIYRFYDYFLFTKYTYPFLLTHPILPQLLLNSFIFLNEIICVYKICISFLFRCLFYLDHCHPILHFSELIQGLKQFSEFCVLCLIQIHC